MKTSIKLLFIFTVLFCGLNNATAQFMSNEEANNMQKSHVILGLTDNEEVNETLRNAVKNYWTLTEIKEEMPAAEAVEKVKDDGSVTVIMLGTDVTRERTDIGGGWDAITKASSLYIGINTKGHRNANLIQHTRGWSEDQLIFGLTTIQDAIRCIITHNLSGMAKVKDVYKERTPNLKNYTLLINESQMSPKLTKSTIAETYSHPFEIVSHEEWVSAIKDKKEGYAYVNIIPVPVGDQIANIGYVISCAELEAFMYFRNKGGFLTAKGVKAIVKNLE